MRNNISNIHILNTFLLLIVLSCNSYLATSLTVDTSYNSESEYWGIFVYVDVCSDDLYADHLYKALKSTSRWNTSNMRYLHQENATKQKIFNSLDWLRNQSDYDDFVVFTMACHGNIDIVAPFNANSQEECITATELKEKLDAIEYKGMCVMIDSCQSGIFGNKLTGINRVVLKSTFRKGDGWVGTGAGKWYSFTKFIGDAILKKIDYNKDSICSAEETLQYAQQEFLPLVKIELHPRLWIPRLIMDILYGVPLRYLSITIPYPTINDDYPGDFALTSTS